MKAKKGILYALSFLLLLGTVFRVGYEIELDGQKLPGVYAPRTVEEAENLARKAAEEICRGEEIPGYKLTPAVCVKYADPEKTDLPRLLLTSYEGVAELHQVYAGQSYLGLTSDPGIIWAIKEDYIAGGADYITATGYLTEEITVEPVLARAEDESTVTELSCALREASEVVYVRTMEDMAVYGKG